MKNLIAFLLVLALSTVSACAQTSQYLQFGSDGSPSAKWVGQPPSNAVVYLWAPSTDAGGKPDEDLRNYKLINNAVVYAPAPVAVPPNMSAFKDSIWADNAIPLYAKLQLTIFFPVLESYLPEPAKIQTAWAAVCMAYSPEAAGPLAGWATPAVKAAVEADAATAHIPLTP